MIEHNSIFSGTSGYSISMFSMVWRGIVPKSTPTSCHNTQRCTIPRFEEYYQVNKPKQMTYILMRQEFKLERIIQLFINCHTLYINAIKIGQ